MAQIASYKQLKLHQKICKLEEELNYFKDKNNSINATIDRERWIAILSNVIRCLIEPSAKLLNEDTKKVE